MRMSSRRWFSDEDMEPTTVRAFPWALGFVLFAVLALLLGAAGVVLMAALGFRPHWGLCALAVFCLELLLFYVAFGRGGGKTGNSNR